MNSECFACILQFSTNLKDRNFFRYIFLRKKSIELAFNLRKEIKINLSNVVLDTYKKLSTQSCVPYKVQVQYWSLRILNIKSKAYFFIYKRVQGSYFVSRLWLEYQCRHLASAPTPPPPFCAQKIELEFPPLWKLHWK